MSDILIETWANIAKFLGISKRSILYRRKRMVRDGFVFYRKRRRGEQEVASAWASSLKRYVELRGNPKKNT